MTGQCRILLGLLPAEEDAIASALYSDDTIATVGSGADATELLTLAAGKEADLVLVSSQLPGLEVGHVEWLRARGLRTAGVAIDPASLARLHELGVDSTLELPVSAADLAALTVDRPAAPAEVSRTAEVGRAAEVDVARDGSVLAVVGSRGTPGASELAASFAAAVSRDWSALLCELDGDGGQLAVRLGLDPRAGSIVGPLRALNGRGGGTDGLLEHWVTEPGRGWPTVLVGPLDPRDLTDTVTAGTVHRLFAVLGASFPLVICDVGHRLRTTDPPVDTATRLHRDAIAAADVVIAVIGSRAEQVRVGLAQVELLLGELAVTPDRLRVVVNGQPGCGRADRGQTAAVINRELPALGVAVDAWLPYDEKAFQAAARRGQPLVAARPRGAYAQAVRDLAATVLLPGVPQPRARKRRLGAPSPAAVTVGLVEEVRLPWRR